jgi:hypothetical protein
VAAGTLGVLQRRSAATPCGELVKPHVERRREIVHDVGARSARTT